MPHRGGTRPSLKVSTTPPAGCASTRFDHASSSRRVLYPSVHRILSDEVVRFLLLLLLDDDDDDDDDYHYDSSSSSSSLVRDS